MTGARIITAFRELFAGMRDDREAAYTDLRRRYEAKCDECNALRDREAARYDADVAAQETLHALLDVVHALEDAAAVRDARLQEMAQRMHNDVVDRDVDGKHSYDWKAACDHYLHDYADLLALPESEEP